MLKMLLGLAWLEHKRRLVLSLLVLLLVLVGLRSGAATVLLSLVSHRLLLNPLTLPLLIMMLLLLR